MKSKAEWKRGGRCDTSACVEVAMLPDMIGVRNSAGVDVVWFTPQEWDVFVAGVKAGEFDCDVNRG